MGIPPALRDFEVRLAVRNAAEEAAPQFAIREERRCYRRAAADVAREAVRVAAEGAPQAPRQLQDVEREAEELQRQIEQMQRRR